MKVLVTGREGQIARSLAARSSDRFRFVTLGRPELDITQPDSVRRAIAATQPVAVVNAAAYTAVDRAEADCATALAVNGEGAGHVARAAAEAGLPVIHLSTDYVFAGGKPTPYVEEDPVGPQGAYGRSKLAGEHAVAAANPAHVVLRTAWVYSPFGTNFVKTMLRLAAERDVVRVVADQEGTPTYAADIAAAIEAVLDRVMEGPQARDWRGTFHLVAAGEASWAEFAEAIFAGSTRRGGPRARVEPIGTADYPTPARRPANSRLSNARFRHTFEHQLPHWRDGLARCLDILLAR
ncbi:MAG: dTDP-4-dehydrorhamnose reductase [Pararhizobium sp.]